MINYAEEKKDLLKWLSGQHEAIQVTSFEWRGLHLEFDGYWYKVEGEEFPTWEHAIDYGIIMLEKIDLIPADRKHPLQEEVDALEKDLEDTDDEEFASYLSGKIDFINKKISEDKKG